MKGKKIPVLVTTVHRGVFFGYISPDEMGNKTVSLKSARMAIKWGTEKGIMELCETGPTHKSLIGSRADIASLHDVTAIFLVTDEAEKKWND